MRRTLQIIGILAFVVLIGLIHEPEMLNAGPPLKWSKIDGVIYNKTADSVGIILGNDTTWFLSGIIIVDTVVGANFYKWTTAEPDSQLITKAYADGLGGAGEVNTLVDTGTANGTEAFGLTQTKVGTQLRIRMLKEGSNITMAYDGDSAVTITSTGGAGSVDSAGLDFGSGSYKWTSEKAWAMKLAASLAFTAPTDSAGIDTTTLSVVDDGHAHTTTTISGLLDADHDNNALDPDKLVGDDIDNNKVDSNIIVSPVSRAVEDASGNVITTTYETIVNVDKIGDDTTGWNLTESRVDQDLTIGASPTLDATNISGITTGAVEQIRTDVRKSSSGTITNGMPVYIVSYGTNWIYVEAADASDPAKMPALGMVLGDVTNTATGICVVMGELTGQVTDTNSVGNGIYVASGGGWTETKPVGTNLIQKMGLVLKSNVATGVIGVVGAGRTNDIPNVATIIGDWTNTAYPWSDNEVSNDLTISGYFDTAATIDTMQGLLSYYLPLSGGILTGNISMAGVQTVDGVDVSALDDAVAADSAQWNTVGVVERSNDSVWVRDADGDSLYVAVDAANGYVKWDIGSDQDSLGIGVDNASVVRIGAPGMASADSLTVGLQFNLPTDANPTTSEVGRASFDTDDKAIEINDGTVSKLMPTIFTAQGTIYSPADANDSICVFDIDSLSYPHGIQITGASVEIAADAAYTIRLLEYSAADPRAYIGVITTLTTGASDTRQQSAPSVTVEQGNAVYLAIPSTTTDWMKFTFRYYIKDGD